MFYFLHKLGSFFFRKPSLNYIQPKSINLYFSNSLDKKYTWLNLEKYSLLQPVIEAVNNQFLLSVDTENKGGEKATIDIASFETKKEAENALVVLRNKMFSPEKSIIKLSILALILVFMWGLILDIFIVSNRNAASALNTPVNSSLTAEQIKLIEQLPRQINPAPITPPEPAVNPEPSNKTFLDSLGK